MLEVLQQAWCRSTKLPVLLALPQSPVSSLEPAAPPPPAPSACHGFPMPSGHSCPTVAAPQTKPAVSHKQTKDSSCSCLGALQPLLSSVLTSSVGVLLLTPWTRREDMRGRLSQQEGRGGDAGGAQLGTERVSSIETPPCRGSAQAFGERVSVSSSCRHKSHGQWGLNNKNLPTHPFGAQPSEIQV